VADVKSTGADDTMVVEKILEKLGADDAEILRLRYIADLSVKDIAKALNINSINARVKLHRAVKRAQGFVLASS
jgi:RNA polymerase sigma factor (sigma-70 family)